MRFCHSDGLGFSHIGEFIAGMIVSQYQVFFGEVQVNVYHREFSALPDKLKHGGLKYGYAAIGAFRQIVFRNGEPFFARLFIAPAAEAIVLVE